MEFDDNGWVSGRIELLPASHGWSLLSPEPEARIEEHRWAHQARVFFGAELALVQKKSYPSGATPMVDAVEVDVARAGGAPSRVLVLTVPLDRAPEVRAAAAAGVRAIGGRGFDALLARARRAWQVREPQVAGDDARAPLTVAAILAAVLLAPVVPPGEATIFGVKGARERLSRAGL
ncbi:hypothetical protein SOCEGT47_052930 [Sorangium cellulosum]|uniref:Uncharacterized protein n=1 Tax=Sorangium cellulosum TaxID=56 RepID=A0A4P2Q5P1_SORCE|nr:hypothetical protein [Sorangium cellulosum]AUX24754.1 hypothetical protein SOCEGT47_052930 [Sorangium cellulosum]